MLRKSLLIASLLSTFVLSFDASAQPELRELGLPSPALEQLFSRPQLEVDSEQLKRIVSYRWAVPGQEYEARGEPQFGERQVTKWVIHPDGSLSGTNAEGVTRVGYLDQSGLPVIKSTFDGKSVETRLELVGDGFAVVMFQNQSEAADKPPVWREIYRAKRQALSMAEESQLLAQWELDRKKSITPPPGYDVRMVQLPLEAPVEVTLTKSDKWQGLGFRKVCVRLPDGEGHPFRLNMTGTGRILAGPSPDCVLGGLADREEAISLRFYTTKTNPFLMAIAQKDTSIQLTLHRMSPEEVAQWKIDERNEQIAANQREASSGESGLAGALAMGLGAALAGGNPEQVMGMAMKGAELTTDNEMSRSVLAGQGDAMVAEGTQRMIARNARSNGAGAASGSSATHVGPGGVAGTSNRLAVSVNAVATEVARRKMYSWCWASTGGRAVFMSSVGSRDVTVHEQQQWRSAMESEFKQQISGAYDNAQCDIDDDSDFSYTRGSISADNPAHVPWAPH